MPRGASVWPAGGTWLSLDWTWEAAGVDVAPNSGPDTGGCVVWLGAVDKNGAAIGPAAGFDGTAVMAAGAAAAGDPEAGAAVELMPTGAELTADGEDVTELALDTGVEVVLPGAKVEPPEGETGARVDAGSAVAGVPAGDTAKLGSEDGSGT